MRLLLTIGLLAALTPLTARSEEKSELPVQAKLIAKKATYTLNLGGKTGAEFREMIKNAEKAGTRLPAPPDVDIELVITNTSDKEIKIWSSGDPVKVMLKLEGPGAVNATPLLAFTQEFRVPTAATLAPGKSLTIPVKKLLYGHRGSAQMSYWTEPGDYKVTASFETGIQPIPKGAKKFDGFGQVTIKAEAIAIKITDGK